MARSVLNALVATVLTAVSLYLWRITYPSTDWAAMALGLLALAIWLGSWPLFLDTWRVRFFIALREDSFLGKILTGRVRAAFLTTGFTLAAVTLLAWQSLNASKEEACIMLLAFLLSGGLFSLGQNLVARQFHQPFARSLATSLVSWLVAVPFTIFLAYSFWAWTAMPGAMLDADLSRAVHIGLEELPPRGGWIATFLAIPYIYEAIKLWVAVKLADYPVVSILLSFDAALFSFVLCRTAIVVTQFVEAHMMKAPE